MKGRRAPILALLLALLLVLPGCEPLNQALAAPALDEDFSLSDIPAFSGQPYVVVGDNTPQFPEEDLVPVSFEDYSPLDSLGRCGAAYACVSQDTMPTEDRGSIGQVKPSGWHTVRYDCVDGKYLYNRCHLIGYQLTGENANEENLITGTRYMNVEGMLPFEDLVADFVKETGYHVLYRVHPHLRRGRPGGQRRAHGGLVGGGPGRRGVLRRVCLQLPARGGHRLRHRGQPSGGCRPRHVGRRHLHSEHQLQEVPPP